MHSFSTRLGHSLMTATATKTLNSGVQKHVDQQVANMHEAQQQPHLAHAMQEGRITVGPVPRQGGLLDGNTNIGCKAIDAQHRARAPQVLEGLNKDIQAWGGRVEYQWQETAEPLPTIGVAQCEQVNEPVRAHPLPPVPRRRFSLVDEVQSAVVTVAPVNGTAVNGTVEHGVFETQGDTSDWEAHNGQWPLHGVATAVTLGSGAPVPGDCLTGFSASAANGTLSVGELFCEQGLLPESWKNAITVVSLEEGASDEQMAFQLTKGVMQALGMQAMPHDQADLMKLNCEVRPGEPGQPMVASMFQPSEGDCLTHGIFATPPQSSGEPGPLDKFGFVQGTLGNHSQGLNASGAPVPEGLSLTEVQGAVRAMVARMTGDEATGACLGALAATAVHHLFSQGAARLSKPARWWINNVVAPIARAVVYAAVRYQFSGGAASFFRTAGIAIPIAGQFILVKAVNLGAFLRAAAHVLQVLNVAYTGWEVYNGNVVPAKDLLFALLGAAVGNVLFAGLDLLFDRISPLADPKARERLEERLYGSPAASSLVACCDRLVLHSTPAQALYAALPDFLKTALDGVRWVDATAALGLNQLATMRWLTSRLCPIGPRQTDLQADDEVEMDSIDDGKTVELAETPANTAQAPQKTGNSIESFVTGNPVLDLGVPVDGSSSSSAEETVAEVV